MKDNEGGLSVSLVLIVHPPSHHVCHQTTNYMLIPPSSQCNIITSPQFCDCYVFTFPAPVQQGIERESVIIGGPLLRCVAGLQQCHQTAHNYLVFTSGHMATSSAYSFTLLTCLLDFCVQMCVCFYMYIYTWSLLE